MESEAAGLAKRNPSIVIEARSSSLSLAESNESNGAAVVHRQEELNGQPVFMAQQQPS